MKTKRNVKIGIIEQKPSTQTTSSRFCADAPEYKTRNNAKMIIALNQ